MMLRLFRPLAASVVLAMPLAAQTQVTIGDLGPGPAGRLLRDALARPHRLVEPDTGWFQLARGQQDRQTIIVIGRTAAISGTVDADVIVVGGDLFIRPGADVSGEAIAIGGGAYASTLAHVGKGTRSFRDGTYSVARTTAGYQLEYQSLRGYPSPPLLFPGIYGLRMPTYDRVNGASVKFGPTFTFGDGLGELTGLATYRSDLGKIDPSLSGRLRLSRRLRMELEAARGTFSNDAWIWSDFVNSFSVLTVGTDTRNYYRADRVQATAHRLWETSSARLEPFLGGRYERGWSVGPFVGETRSPFSFFGRRDSLAMRRPNMPINDGTMISALAGTMLDWTAGGVTVKARTEVETSLGDFTPKIGAAVPVSFIQATADLAVGFFTFGEQEYGLDVHWVTTPGDTPPLQRFVHIGGPGTLPFLDPLAQAGDELLLIDQRYSVPLLNIRVGIMGNPTLQFRDRIGSAGVGKLPAFEQILGFGVELTIIRGEVQVDPRTRKLRFSVGFTFAR
jgi:hypothetical protein